MQSFSEPLEPATKLISALNSRNAPLFWQLADAAARLQAPRRRLEFVSAFDELEAHYGFMNRSYVRELCVRLHNRNHAPARIRPERAIASFLYDWDVLSQNGYNPRNLPFSEWYRTELTVYRGIGFNPLYRDDLPRKMSIPESRVVSTSLDRETAIDFTQAGRARGEWRDKARRDGWLLSAQVAPSRVLLFNDVGGEHECLIRGAFAFTRAERIINGEVSQDVESWGSFAHYKTLLGEDDI